MQNVYLNSLIADVVNSNKAMVHCRLRPRHPFTMDSSTHGDRRRLGHNQYDAAGALA